MFPRRGFFLDEAGQDVRELLSQVAVLGRSARDILRFCLDLVLVSFSVSALPPLPFAGWSNPCGNGSPLGRSITVALARFSLARAPMILGLYWQRVHMVFVCATWRLSRVPPTSSQEFPEAS